MSFLRCEQFLCYDTNLTSEKNHLQNKHKELCDKREVISEILLKFTLKLSKTIISLNEQIIHAKKEIEQLEK